MLRNFLEAKRPISRAPDGMRIYAVGDIHGCADLLDRLTADIVKEESADRSRTQLIFLGDYIDRGPDSCGVIERLIAIRRDRPNTVFLKGNHEAVFLDFLSNPADYADWMAWGGGETLESYGVHWLDDAKAVSRDIGAKIPKSHLGFLRELELWRVFGDYLFVHAGLRPGRPIEEQDERDLLWIRGEFHRAAPADRPDKVVVHGHQPLKKPLDAGWRIDVDTGACFAGKLTAVVLEGETRRFIST